MERWPGRKTSPQLLPRARRGLVRLSIGLGLSQRTDLANEEGLWARKAKEGQGRPRKAKEGYESKSGPMSKSAQAVGGHVYREDGFAFFTAFEALPLEALPLCRSRDR
ncbi:MAG: hypothetical protein EBY21_02190 [Alphaproteobacteria bacterium]|nr:hypothetical protein [Alphaproteobacteria bacterium]